MSSVSGILVDIARRRQYKARITIEQGSIAAITPDISAPDRFILPGFIDAHIHIESSMLIPSAFARLAVQHGTVATVADPHEIANVCGRDGVLYMMEDGAKVPLKFCYGVPSCVPATPFETAGATLDAAAVAELLGRPDTYHLAEMMNWPGVLAGDAEVVSKIQAARAAGKPVDGHAPGVKGADARKYASAGITTDHECFTLEEALDKLAAGMYIQIREGSAAKNFDALAPLFDTHAGKLMLASDDKHPDDLMEGHINRLVARAVKQGYNLYDVLHAACVLPAEHYKLPVGRLREGDPADFIITDSLETFGIQETWIDGTPAWQRGRVMFPEVASRHINHFEASELRPSQLRVASGQAQIPVIEARDGQLMTGKLLLDLPRKNGEVLADPARDVLKICVVNRYKKAEPAVGFIKHFGLKKGAIASSVGHDCHNIIATGSSDAAIARAVTLVMGARGGMATVREQPGGSLQEDLLPLPIAGIMSDAGGEEVGRAYQRLSHTAQDMGSELHAPFMLLSFMALLVIPSLKLSDKGLFDGDRFEFVNWR